MDKLLNFLMVGLGGAVGSMLRYGATLLGSALNLSGNVATFSVNILGSFLIGLLTGCCKEGTLLLLLTVGLCGGFTTFSTFSMQNVRMLQDGKIGIAVVYILATVIVCIIMAWLGYRLGQSR
ncbi:MAG: fluoride efflux transporter CrcB [Bacteroidia bacterium]|nr:fluoride efflux transporter CrcB [Bacteroidia bacterium]